MDQPREFRVLGWIGGIAFVIIASAFTVQLFGSITHRLEPNAVRKIKDACGFHDECKVRLGDLFPGDWDTLYTFGPGTTQADLDAILGRGRLHSVPSERGRLLVLTRHGKILQHELDPSGPKLPIPDQVEFLDRRRNLVLHGAFTQDTVLWATASKIHPDQLQSDTYYILSPADLSPTAD